MQQQVISFQNQKGIKFEENKKQDDVYYKQNRKFIDDQYDQFNQYIEFIYTDENNMIQFGSDKRLIFNQNKGLFDLESEDGFNNMDKFYKYQLIYFVGKLGSFICTCSRVQMFLNVNGKSYKKPFWDCITAQTTSKIKVKHSDIIKTASFNATIFAKVLIDFDNQSNITHDALNCDYQLIISDLYSILENHVNNDTISNQNIIPRSDNIRFSIVKKYVDIAKSLSQSFYKGPNIYEQKHDNICKFDSYVFKLKIEQIFKHKQTLINAQIIDDLQQFEDLHCLSSYRPALQKIFIIYPLFPKPLNVLQFASINKQIYQAQSGYLQKTLQIYSCVIQTNVSFYYDKVGDVLYDIIEFMFDKKNGDHQKNARYVTDLICRLPKEQLLQCLVNYDLLIQKVCDAVQYLQRHELFKY